MLIRIPVNGAEIDGATYVIEFDSAKVDRVEMSRGMTDVEGRKEFTGRSTLTLEFAELADAPKWVKAEGEPDGT